MNCRLVKHLGRMISVCGGRSVSGYLLQPYTLLRVAPGLLIGFRIQSFRCQHSFPSIVFDIEREWWKHCSEEG